jgi:AcrR family transcriptional regulator
MDHSPIAQPLETDGPQDRQARILDAAERCFVRSGFHRTTMQDVAAESGMSPGNLYRYFKSKDAIVVGLAERDRARIGDDFSAFAGAEDVLAVFRAMAWKHFAEEPRERAILCLEIWSEATRNEAFASITQGFDNDIIGRMTAVFQEAKDRGVVAPSVDPMALATVVSILADGLFVRRAVVPGFDPNREVGYVIAVIEAAFAGGISLPAHKAQPLENPA